MDSITKGIADAHGEIDGRLSEAGLNATYAPASALVPAALRTARMPMQIALADRFTRKINGVMIGSSSIEGANATPRTLRVASLLEKMLQASFNPADVPGGYILKGNDAAWQTSGSVAASAYDLGLTNRLLPSGTSMTHNPVQPIDGVHVTYLEGPGQNPFVVSFAGKTWTVTPATSGVVRATGSWQSPIVAEDRHTVQISSAVGDVSIGNVHLQRGDRDLGVTLYNAGKSGASVATFLPAGADTMWERIAEIDPDFVPMLWGNNDVSGGRTAAQFKADLEAVLDKIDAATTRQAWVPIIVQPPALSLTSGQRDTYEQYWQAMREIAAARPGVTVHDTRPYWPTDEVDDVYDLVDTDLVHPTTKGHAWEAQIIAEQWELPSRVAWPGVRPAAVDLDWDWTADPDLVAYWDPNLLAEAVDATVAAVPLADGIESAPLTAGGSNVTVVAGPNGRKGVRTTASTNSLAATFGQSYNTPATVVAIFKRTSSTGPSYIWNGVSTNYLTSQISGSPRNITMGTNLETETVAQAVADTNWHIAVAVYDAANSRYYIDSRTPIDMPGLNTTGVTFNGMSVGQSNTGSRVWEGVTAGLAVFRRVLEQGEIDLLLDDLVTKTGLTVTS
ncbi:hypothetical protein QR64_00245 [Rhodococcus sp. Chr-9]|nr:hypothetical protein QR64_00245 [Rhodococcus sp. Chr-9]